VGSYSQFKGLKSTSLYVPKIDGLSGVSQAQSSRCSQIQIAREEMGKVAAWIARRLVRSCLPSSKLSRSCHVSLPSNVRLLGAPNRLGKLVGLLTAGSEGTAVLMSIGIHGAADGG
jgi:hypothetical protein